MLYHIFHSSFLYHPIILLLSLTTTIPFLTSTYAACTITSNPNTLTDTILRIDVSEICKINPYELGETLPELLPELGGLLTQVNKNSYEKHRLNSVLNLFEYSDFPKIDQLLCDFYSLSDDGRKELFQYIAFLNTNKKDFKREKIISDLMKNKP